jgi:hypothetical protein
MTITKIKCDQCDKEWLIDQKGWIYIAGEFNTGKSCVAVGLEFMGTDGNLMHTKDKLHFCSGECLREFMEPTWHRLAT